MAFLNDVVLGQFEAALSVLHQAVAQCPESDWSSAHPDAPFSQVAFHVLLFTDIYLGWDEEAVKAQEFHLEHRATFADYEELEDQEPVRTYDRDFILRYLQFCLDKGRSSIPLESEEILLGESGFSYRRFSRLELHLYSIRHLQHHAAQLGLRNQLSTGMPLDWVSTGWRGQ